MDVLFERIEISLSELPKVSCRNTRSIIAYVTENQGYTALAHVFEGILEPGLKDSMSYTYRGQPLTLDFFENIDNWFPYKLMLQIFSNLDRMGVDAFEIGHYSIKRADKANNVLITAIVQVAGAERTLRKAGEINARYNKTKTVEVMECTGSSITVKAQYLPGVTHTPYVSRQNMGAYVGVLEYIGLENIKCEIVEDELERDPGYTIWRATWKRKSFWSRARWISGYWVARWCCQTYMKSEHSVNRYHKELLESHKKSELEKERKQRESDRYYAQLVKEQKDKQKSLELMVVSRTRELQKALKQQEELFQNVTHEFKTPLTLIMGQVERFQKEKITLSTAPDLLDKRLSTIDQSARQLLKLVENLLRKEEQEALLLQIPTKLGEEILRIVEDFQPVAQKLGVKLETEIDKNLQGSEYLIVADSVYPIVSNLVSNAIKYAPKNSTVLVLLNVEDTVVEIVVADNGKGISSEEKKTMRERFKKGTGLEAGNGLGLSIVEHFTRINNGILTIGDNKPHGARVQVSLPLQARTNNTPVISTSVPQLFIKPANNKKGRLLLAEDDPGMQAYLQEILGPIFDLKLVGDGAEALEWLKTNVPEIIVSDVMMPQVNGYQLCQQVKKDPGLAHIPFIMLSAKGDCKSQKIGYEYAADDYIAKPFSADLLVAKLQNQLATWRAYQTKLVLRLSNEQVIAPAKTPDEKFLDRLNQYLAQNFSRQDANVADMAEKLATTTKTLNRKVQALLGKKPVTLLNDYRLSAADEMLKQGKSIGDVAFDCGFGSQSYFGKKYEEWKKTSDDLG